MRLAKKHPLQIVVMFFALCLSAGCAKHAAQPAAVSEGMSRALPLILLQTDFGNKDGAVNAMKGVIYSVDATLQTYDITHDVPHFNVWEASYRLLQVLPYWPRGTVFVSVVDPGVGSHQQSVVALAKNGQIFVAPNNGTLTLVDKMIGIDKVVEIDRGRFKYGLVEGVDVEQSYTFYGRDVYAYVAALLASGKESVDSIGEPFKHALVRFAYEPGHLKGESAIGMVPVLDPQYGNVWTNISRDVFEKLKPSYGEHFNVVISRGDQRIYSGKMPFTKTFSDVPKGKPLAYYNSLGHLSFALNQQSFSGKYKVEAGLEWNVIVSKATP